MSTIEIISFYPAFFLETELLFLQNETDELKLDSTIKLYNYLEQEGIRTKLLKKLNNQKVLVQKLKDILINFEFHKIVTESYTTRRDLEEGTELEIAEFNVVSDDVGAIFENKLLNEKQYNLMLKKSKKVFDLMVDYFDSFDMIIASAKIFFSVDVLGRLYLSSDISPELNIEFWDKITYVPLTEDQVYSRLRVKKL